MILKMISSGCRISQKRTILSSWLQLPYFCFSKVNDEHTFELIMKRLQQNSQKFYEMNKTIIDSALQQRQINGEAIRKQMNRLQPTVTIFEELSALNINITDLQELIKEATDKEEQQMLNQQLKQLLQKKQQLKEESLQYLVEPDVYDEVNQINLELRPGVGGAESSIFVEEISNMFIAYCQSQGWRANIAHSVRQTANRGFRQLIIKVQGADVYRVLKCQSGVHKVIRVPETDTKGRIHSSTISVAVMPTVPFDFTVNDRDIRYEYMRSSGPGGQSVNKTESACRAVHIPTGMSVMIQEDRSQDRNRKRATDILKQRLFQIEWKKNVESETQKRKSQIGTSDRSEKIRTYNYPQDRITDHRTGLTVFGIDDMMTGNYLDQFIKAYMNKIYEQKLAALIQELQGQRSRQV